MAIFEAWIAKKDISIPSQILDGSPLRFKKLFGTEFNKELLIGFLNQVLGDKEQIQDLKVYRDNYSIIKTAVNKKALEIAREMKKDGHPSKMIAKYTGLTKEQVEKL